MDRDTARNERFVLVVQSDGEPYSLTTVSATTGIALLLLAVFTSPSIDTQVSFSVKELAEYRLSLPVLKQFDQASRLVATAMLEDSSLASNPLFTRDVSVLGDAPEAAAQLETRLTNDSRLAAALRGSNISARDYTKFALALFAARLAHGFIKAGVLRFVPPGVAADNVAFIEANEAQVAAVLQVIGVEGVVWQIGGG